MTFSIKFRDREGGHLQSAAWTFGDGSKANGASVDHRYDQKGQYKVQTIACTNTKVCLFGNRTIKIKKKPRRHHNRVHAVALRVR